MCRKRKCAGGTLVTVELYGVELRRGDVLRVRKTDTSNVAYTYAAEIVRGGEVLCEKAGRMKPFTPENPTYRDAGGVAYRWHSSNCFAPWPWITRLWVAEGEFVFDPPEGFLLDESGEDEKMREAVRTNLVHCLAPYREANGEKTAALVRAVSDLLT